MYLKRHTVCSAVRHGIYLREPHRAPWFAVGSRYSILSVSRPKCSYWLNRIHNLVTNGIFRMEKSPTWRCCISFLQLRDVSLPNQDLVLELKFGALETSLQPYICSNLARLKVMVAPMGRISSFLVITFILECHYKHVNCSLDAIVIDQPLGS